MLEHDSQYYIHIGGPSFSTYTPFNNNINVTSMPCSVEDKNRLVFTSWSANACNSTTSKDFKRVSSFEVSKNDVTMVGFLAD